MSCAGHGRYKMLTGTGYFLLWDSDRMWLFLLGQKDLSGSRLVQLELEL